MSSTELAKQRVMTLKQSLESAKGSIAAVAAKHLTPKRLLKMGLAASQRSPKLLECTPQSFVRAIVGCSELGLEPSSLGHVYLVPYNNKGTMEVQLIIGYRGLIELAYRSGQIVSIDVQAVYEGDRFKRVLGLSPLLEHEPMDEDDPAKLTHCYVVIKLQNGGTIVECMTRKQVDRIRSRSKSSSNGPWVTDYAEMAKKTVLRRALKRCPMSIEMTKAEALDIAEARPDESGYGDFDWIDADYAADDAPDTGATAQLKGRIGTPPVEQPALGDE